MSSYKTPKYPKIRPQLPSSYQAIYDEHYKANREGRNPANALSRIMESWMHRAVARTKRQENTVLEIGAGTLNHIPYELSARPVYDIIEPYRELFKDSPMLPRVRNIYGGISELESAEAAYDRIIAIAVFEHILDLPAMLANIKRLITPEGIMCAAIPNQGRFLWKLAYTLTTGAAFRFKYGLNYDTLMNYEHVNEADEIEALIKEAFPHVKSRVFGLSRGLCLYRALFASLKPF